MGGKNYVSYSVQSDPVFDDEGEEIGSESYILIDLVYVTPEERGHGIGRKLLLETIAELEKQPMPIRLCALPKENCMPLERLVGFYQSVGFSAMGEQGGAGVQMEL
jgi:GNAT superfamily N-acetyltransferase